MSKQILLDLDGVLVNLHAAFAYHHNLNYMELIQHEDFTPFVDELWKDTDSQWWSNLPWMFDGRRIIEMCERMVGSENVILCSRPSHANSAEGKLIWIERNLPEYTRRYVLVVDKSCCASPRNLLIDDDATNVKFFREAGGAAILCPRPWNDFAGKIVHDVPLYLEAAIEEMMQ